MIRYLGPILALLALAASACTTVPYPSDPDPAEVLRRRDSWRSRIDSAREAADRGNRKEAEAAFFEGIDALGTSVGNERRVVASLHLLARLYFSDGRLDAASSALEKAVDFAERTLGPTHPDTALAIQNLACVRLAEGNVEEASKLLRLAFERAERSGEISFVGKEPAQDPESESDFSFNINLWPLFEARTLRTGEYRHSFLWLYHVTTRPDGTNYSWHVLNVLSGPDYLVVFPLFYTAGPEGEKYGSVATPLFFWGARSWMAPLLLSGSWTARDGSSTTWLTPLFHLSRRPDGSVKTLLAGPYLQSGDTIALLPLFYRTGREGARYHGILPPALFLAPDSWFAPFLLSGSWRDQDGSSLTWLTPLFHLTRGAGGELESFHVGPYMEGRDYVVLFPVYYETGSEWATYRGILPPLLFTGPKYWIAPLLLSGNWEYPDHTATTWLSPLFHLTRKPEGGVKSLHVGPFFLGDDYVVLFPLYYHLSGQGGNYHGILPPFFLGGPSSWLFPLLLSGRWEDNDGGPTLWLTPLFHVTCDAEGEVLSLHLGPYMEGESYRIAFPFYYEAGQEGNRHRGVLPPLFFQGPGYWAAPLLLSGQWTNDDGSDTLWLTPFFHVSHDARGHLQSLHLGPYIEGPDSIALLPLFWSTGTPGSKDVGVLPFYVGGRGYWFLPPLVTGQFDHSDGSESTWVTPLFHITASGDGQAESAHLAPLFFWSRDDWWAAPPILSGGWTHADGSRTTLVTPFFHQTEDREGRVRSRHLLNYIEGEDFTVLFPVFAQWTQENGTERSIVPLLYHRTVEASGDTTTSILWPLASYRSGEELDTSLEMELRPFLYQTAGDDYEFNFLWRLLSLRRQGPGSRTMVGPFWWSETPGGEVPSEFLVLGGLFARDCDYEKGAYRYRLLWVIPLGAKRFDTALSRALGLERIY